MPAHVMQWVVIWLVAAGLTAGWLLRRPTSRWRHITLGLVSAVLWIPAAYLSNNVATVTDGGTVVTVGSDALVGVGAFMVVVSIVGLVLGLFLWVEETVEEAEQAAAEGLPDTGLRGGD